MIVCIGFDSLWHSFRTLAIQFIPLCQCLSEETLKAVGPLYLVAMSGEVKGLTLCNSNETRTISVYSIRHKHKHIISYYLCKV